MPPRRPTILMIRPCAQSIDFVAEFLNKTGLDTAIITSPVLTIEPMLPLPDPAGAAALVFTSANAVRVFAEGGLGRGMRAYCVGSTTARVAEEAGYNSVSADGDAEDLLGMLIKNHADGDGPYLCLHGEKTASDIPSRLRAKGIPAQSAIIYRQVEKPLSEKARQLIVSRDVIVPVFSANSAKVFARQASRLKPKRLRFVCISQRAAAPLSKLGPPDNFRIADHPGRAAMIAALRNAILAS